MKTLYPTKNESGTKHNKPVHTESKSLSTLMMSSSSTSMYRSNASWYAVCCTAELGVSPIMHESIPALRCVKGCESFALFADWYRPIRTETIDL